MDYGADSTGTAYLYSMVEIPIMSVRAVISGRLWQLASVARRRLKMC